MLGASLADIRLRVLAATRRASKSYESPDAVGYVTEVINGVYMSLLASQPWPHLDLLPRSTFVPVSRGETLYDVPTEVDLNKITHLSLAAEDRVWPMVRGIRDGEYDAYQMADREEYPSRWEVRFTTKPQIEIWPTPSVDGYRLLFHGQRRTPRLVDETDVCMLDDDLMAAYAAAEILTSDDEKDAQLKSSQAQTMLRAMTIHPQASSEEHRLGLGSERRAWRSPVIVVSGR